MSKMKEIYLSPWQTKVWDDTHRFKVINVGRRSGKTVLSIIKLIQEACRDKTITWYISPTYKQSKNIAWSLLKEYMPNGARPVYNETELKCTLSNGSEIHLKGADNPDSLRGTKIDFAVFDEVAFFGNWKSVWEALRPILVDSKAPCWFVSTPNGFNHFYEMYNLQNTSEDYKSFHFTSYDNPYIDAEEIDKTKDQMDILSFNQEFLADFTRPAGTVYSEWNIDNFKEFAYDPNLPIHITFDWGINDPTAVVWLQPSRAEIRVIDYYEASDANIEHFISVINSKSYKPAELYTGDPAGKARTLTTGTSVIEILAQKGIHVRSKDGVKIPEQIRVAHSTMSRLFVSTKAERFRDCLLNYRYPEKKENVINQENEVPIHDDYSHAMRAYEYWCVNYMDIRTDNRPVLKTFAGGDPLTGYAAKKAVAVRSFKR